MSARNAPDNHQVFIGNLPNNIKDDEVRNVFASKYSTRTYVQVAHSLQCMFHWMSECFVFPVFGCCLNLKEETGMRRKCKAIGCALGCPRAI